MGLIIYYKAYIFIIDIPYFINILENYIFFKYNKYNHSINLIIINDKIISKLLKNNEFFR